MITANKAKQNVIKYNNTSKQQRKIQLFQKIFNIIKQNFNKSIQQLSLNGKTSYIHHFSTNDFNQPTINDKILKEFQTQGYLTKLKEQIEKLGFKCSYYCGNKTIFENLSISYFQITFEINW